MSALAIGECVAELRTACRRPIDEAALDTLIASLRSSFEQVLDQPDGVARWADHGQQMRDHGRYLGTLADFFSYRANAPIVGTSELTRAFLMIRDACRVGADLTEERAS